MSKFIKYENLDIKINNNLFYCTSMQISAGASVQRVFGAHGDLIRNAPTNTILGGISLQFYLNEVFPDYILPTTDSEDSLSFSFAGLVIQQCYVRSLSFSVTPFNPILINAELDWFGKIQQDNNPQLWSINKSLANTTNKPRNEKLPDIIHACQSYIADTQGSFGFNSGSVFSFDYSESCDLLPFFKLGDISPFRVAKKTRTRQVEIQGNYISNELVKINGNSASCVIYLKNYMGVPVKQFSIENGIITSQNFNISNNGILQSTINLSEEISSLRVKEVAEPILCLGGGGEKFAQTHPTPPPPDWSDVPEPEPEDPETVEDLPEIEEGSEYSDDPESGCFVFLSPFIIPWDSETNPTVESTLQGWASELNTYLLAFGSPTVSSDILLSFWANTTKFMIDELMDNLGVSNYTIGSSKIYLQKTPDNNPSPSPGGTSSLSTGRLVYYRLNEIAGAPVFYNNGYSALNTTLSNYGSRETLTDDPNFGFFTLAFKICID